MESWKTWRLALDPDRDVLQWGHDNGVVEDSDAATDPKRSSFNGATTMESWKTIADHSPLSSPLQWGHDNGVVEDRTAVSDRADRDMLQWGHDNGVVEDQAPWSAPCRPASMGPRQWSRGRPKARS